MRPDLIARIVNDPFGDPALFLSRRFEKTAFLFDIGDLSLGSRDLLKVTHVFLSHTHMDHFCGFDRLLRLLLGREKTVAVYGPPGIIQQVGARLSAYSWNLVHRYRDVLRFRVTEIGETTSRTHVFSSRLSFKAEEEMRGHAVSGGIRPILETEDLTVTAVPLDHGIPCIAYRVTETARIQIRPDALARHGYVPGPWLGKLKQALYAGRPGTDMIQPAGSPGHRAAGETGGHAAAAESPPPCSLGKLRDRLTKIRPGQSIVYITDLAGTRENIRRAAALARNADHLFIEAVFLEADQKHAGKKHHLTARQAGWIAGASGAKRYTLFHFSARYEKMNPGREETQAVFYAEAARGVAEGAAKRGRNTGPGGNAAPVPCPFSYPAAV
ncbi:MAG: ribonuclease Z [Desulfobacterales bacterium]|nr:MAG: ribonuclease Z [Desulfobacterales bacterium]